LILVLRAIVAAANATTGQGGHGSLRAIVSSRVAALATAHDGVTADREALLEHHRIVQSIFERTPCLPARFGSIFADKHAVWKRLVERDEQLAVLLARIGTRCELAVTLAWRNAGPSTTTDPSSGREYLERGLAEAKAMRQREQRAAALVARLLDELPIERAFIRHETCPRPTVAVSMSALVTRDSIGVVRPRIEDLGAELRDVTTIIQGPWPPYSFAVTA